MGCADIFCFLCGNPCRGMGKNYIDSFLEIVREREKIIQKHGSSKHQQDLRYGKHYNYYKNNPDYKKKIEKFSSAVKWMYTCTFLSAYDEVIHNCYETSCNIVFTCANRTFNHSIFRSKMYPDESHGIFIHTDCWTFIKKKYGIELKYSDLPVRATNVKISGAKKSEDKIFAFINYGKIEKYWEQEFDFIKVLADGNQHLCQNPNEGHNTNILKVFNKLKIRKTRPSPLVSASFYKNDTIKIGNDNNFYIVKNGKWIKITDKIIEFNAVININNKNNFFKSLGCVGEASHIPAFIKSIQTKNKGVLHVKIVTFQNIVDKIKKKI